MDDNRGAGDLRRDPTTVKQLRYALLHMIARGLLKPDERINEVRLSRAFGVSRGPLREAARALEAEGLLVSTANRGFSVFPAAIDDLIDLYELKPELDRALYHDLARHADDDTLNDLAAMVDALPHRDPTDFAEALIRFRRATYRQLRNRVLARHALAFARRDFALTPVVPLRIARERIDTFHEALRATWREVRARNPDGARAQMAADAQAARATLVGHRALAAPVEGRMVPA